MPILSRGCQTLHFADFGVIGEISIIVYTGQQSHTPFGAWTTTNRITHLHFRAQDTRKSPWMPITRACLSRPYTSTSHGYGILFYSKKQVKIHRKVQNIFSCRKRSALESLRTTSDSTENCVWHASNIYEICNSDRWLKIFGFRLLGYWSLKTSFETARKRKFIGKKGQKKKSNHKSHDRLIYRLWWMEGVTWTDHTMSGCGNKGG